jgi:hypothetical protein
MRARLTFAAVALVALVVLATPVAQADLLPPPPAIPTPPEELQPLLELLAGPGGIVTEPGCAVLGTVLGLGAIVVPGLPGTIEAQTGLALSGLPVALQPELLSLVNTVLFVQGSGCGLLPLAAERTVCATDDDLAASLAQVREQLSLPGLPVKVGDFVPVPAPTAGSIVDTFRVLATLSVPGAAEVVAALNEVGDCGLRTRFTNVEPPTVPAEPTPAPPTPPPPGPIAPASVPPARLPVLAPGPAVPAAPIATPSPAATAPTSTSALPTHVPESVPRWLQWLAIAALVAFLYRAISPPPSRPSEEAEGDRR